MMTQTLTQFSYSKKSPMLSSGKEYHRKTLIPTSSTPQQMTSSIFWRSLVQQSDSSRDVDVSVDQTGDSRPFPLRPPFPDRLLSESHSWTEYGLFLYHPESNFWEYHTSHVSLDGARLRAEEVDPTGSRTVIVQRQVKAGRWDLPHA